MLTDPILWIACTGKRKDGQPGKCGRKLARLTDDGRFEIKHLDLFVYICSGTSLLICPTCGAKCLLLCKE